MRSSSGSATPSATGWAFSATGDGSIKDVYACLYGFLQQMELSEQDTGVVAMMTYGLLKAEDLELLPTTWRAQLQAALRMAVLQLQADRGARAAEKLRLLVEPWRPAWERDYDALRRRGAARALMASAQAAAMELYKAPAYKDSELEWDREIRVVDEASDTELASI